MDYAAGRIDEDIDTVPARGDVAVHGPVAISADGKRFATGVAGRPFATYGVRVYDLAQRKALHTFIGHAGPVTARRSRPVPARRSTRNAIVRTVSTPALGERRVCVG